MKYCLILGDAHIISNNTKLSLHCHINIKNSDIVNIQQTTIFLNISKQIQAIQDFNISVTISLSGNSHIVPPQLTILFINVTKIAEEKYCYEAYEKSNWLRNQKIQNNTASTDLEMDIEVECPRGLAGSICASTIVEKPFIKFVKMADENLECNSFIAETKYRQSRDEETKQRQHHLR